MVHTLRSEILPVTRSLIAALATFAVIWFIYWVPCAIALEIAFGRPHWIWVIRLLASTVAAVMVARYTWRHKSLAPQGLIGCMMVGAAVGGGLGFAAGFFGPMIFDPGSQGPILGIVTGPLGFLVGTIAGAFYWAWWTKKQDRRQSEIASERYEGQ
jgi:hypothetical protein